MWPAYIVKKSERLLDTENIENKFFPLYNDILQECFPRHQFSVCPQYTTPEAPSGGIGAIEFTITYIIEALDLDSPVFFLEIKPPTHLAHISTRKNAENQVRVHFREIANLVKVEKLYGVSAIGRRLSYLTYTKETGYMHPEPISVGCMIDTAPVGRWDTNIMEPDGYAKFMAVVEEVKQMVLTLP